jgi:ATP-dependent DNA helicase RecG
LCRRLVVTLYVALNRTPHGEGPINPDNFAPFPKNPLIAKFFIQLGRAEELGSGVLNISRLAKTYAGNGQAAFIEGNTFKTMVPLPEEIEGTDFSANDTINDTINELGDTVNDTVKERWGRIIQFIEGKPGIRMQELVDKLNVSEITVKRDIQKLKKLVEFRGPQKTGGYFLTAYLGARLNSKK